VIKTLEQARERLRQFRPRRQWWRRLFARRSAVAILMRRSEDASSHDGLEVLMIERAHRDGDRWSGHMAFPGGMVDPQDANTLAGAIRETREEIGIDLHRDGVLLARLSDIVSISHIGHRRPLIISPYVFELTQAVTLHLNYEVATVVWVPLQFLADRGNRGQMDWKRKNMPLKLPYYTFQDKRIWGLSLHMLDELMATLSD
jgi:8-oxo-dGTP pyrophosphatase MutT (NUDIX family)